MTEAAQEDQAKDVPPLLEIRNLNKTFTSGRMRSRRAVRAVNEVSLSVLAGESVSLVGESGSGKSTVARLVTRLVRPTSGQILLNGQDVVRAEPRGASRAYRRQVQMVFQDPFSSLNPVHTVRHHLMRAIKIHQRANSRTRDKVLTKLLHDVGLSTVTDIERRYPHELSGGQRQRVAIARALAANPALIVADEPTSMLDVSIRAGILNLLDDLRRTRGVGMLLITHDLASAHYSTERTLVMYAGYLVESAPTEALIASPKHPYSQLLVQSVPRRSNAGTALPATARQDAARDLPGETGCPFAPRCPQRLPACQTTMPGVERLGDDRWVRCHLFGPGDPSANLGTSVAQNRAKLT